MSAETPSTAPSPELQLRHPPIVEVACGFEFEPLPWLDALMLGRIWAEVFSGFPVRMAQPPIAEEGTIRLLTMPEMRAWYMSEDETRLVQLQRDRLVFNWRLMSSVDYPRFRSRGDTKGVLDSALEALEAFLVWSRAHQSAPRLRSASVTKVDLFEEGRHWASVTEIGRWIPVLEPVLASARGEPERIEMRLDVRDGGVLQTLVLRNGLVREHVRQVRMETTASDAFDGNARAQLERLNSSVNGLFVAHVSELAREHMNRGESA